MKDIPLYMSKFVHLHTHSHYSLLDGLPKIDALVAHAKELGMDSLALTDHGNLYGAVEFYKKAAAAGIKPIFGVEAYIAAGSRFEKNATVGGKQYYHLILLAENETGWKNLIQLVTKANLEGFYYKPRMDKELLRQHHEGLIALSACLAGELSQYLLQNRYEDAKRAAREYQDIFGKDNFFVEIGNHPGIPETVKVRDSLIRIGREIGAGLAATQDIHYLKKEDAEAHEILLAVQTGNKLNDPDRLSLKNDDFSMRAPEEMASLFLDYPEAVENTTRIAERCNVALKLGAALLPRFSVPTGENSTEYLKKIVYEKAPLRYAALTREVKDRIEYELGVITKTGFADYFLIVQDFINWAKGRGIVVGPGRGSAAGSIVSYILNITDVDPIQYELLFERFLNPDRVQMPDIDIDFTDVRRDEVISYLREKYGERNVAQIITFGTMAARAAVRDVGRALGMGYAFCDRIAKLIPFNQNLDTALQTVNELKELYDANADARRTIDGARSLEGVARHASVHACGTVIASEPLTEYLPLQRSPQDENTIITQFEMHSVEDLGLLKMDLLGLKNLTIIEDTINLIRELQGVNMDISAIPLNDGKTFALLKVANTTGVFQFESSGMRRYMKEIIPHELEDLIALVALYRPGPMDLIPAYINRKHGREQIEYLHPRLEPILKKTYGVGVYQEQMMSIARDLAGYTLAEADTLRKAIGKKIKKLLDEQQEKLIKGMSTNGIDARTAAAIWDLFPPFARYGFNRSHAVCYAVIGYRTAYLKAHYPVEFMTSLLNADSGDVDRISFLVSECGKMGIRVLPPDINKSSTGFMPHESTIRFGLAAIKNIGRAIVEALIVERQRNGEFQNLTDLLRRVDHKDLNKKSLESLIKAGALNSLGVDRDTALHNIDEIVKFNSALKKSYHSSQTGLFGNAATLAALRLQPPKQPASPHEKLGWEKELLGLYISDHPLNIHKEKLAKAGTLPIKTILETGESSRFMKTAGVVASIQKIVTKTGKPMAFVKVADFDSMVEVIVFPDIFAETHPVWKEGAVVYMRGKPTSRDGETRFICEKVVEL